MVFEIGVVAGIDVIAGHKAALHHPVTNGYRKAKGDWKLAHHHAELSDALVEILKLPSDAP
jgi:ketosteroid isomerase-like protein